MIGGLAVVSCARSWPASPRWSPIRGHQVGRHCGGRGKGEKKRSERSSRNRKRKGPSPSSNPRKWPSRAACPRPRWPSGRPERGGGGPQAAVHDRYATGPVHLERRSNHGQATPRCAGETPSAQEASPLKPDLRGSVALLPAPAGTQRRGLLGARCPCRRRRFHRGWSTGDAGSERPDEALGPRSQDEDPGRRRDLLGGASPQTCVVSPDGRLAALAAGDKVHVFDTPPEKRRSDRFRPKFPATDLLAGRDRLVIVDNRIRWFNAVSGEQIATFARNIDRVSGLALSADGRRWRSSGTVTLAESYALSPGRGDAESNAVSQDRQALGGTISAAALSPDGQWIAFGCSFDRPLRFSTPPGAAGSRSIRPRRVAPPGAGLRRRRREAGHGGCRRDRQDLGGRSDISTSKTRRS